ncbi:M23 family metallopeptidase [Desertivirga arenae]|uniref:M23 family metallopeptidase n=1 Tax=Desertivirga arenae TaxID=2810309 RepID=UPI001A9604E2|nr:M23 family metallopeptidase [Pedobacter sp. SYSU D00823]
MKNFWTLRLDKNILQHALTLLAFSVLHFSAYTQEVNGPKAYPTDFRPPLDLKPSIAGSFGEIRANHFHSGLDFRTNQREGYPVYAVADGYVSRLRVQVGGFGNAVYIAHPNGYTSVYAHLQRFNERIGLQVKDFQYRKQSFDVDFPLMPIEIPVKKGDIIAWSGNTGSSGGPHLHFELRDSQTEETINPQLFGLEVPDNVPPQITGLYLYQLNGQPFSPSTPRKAYSVSGSNGDYRLSQGTVSINGESGFGIVTFDQQVAGGNKNGVYSTELFLDEKLIFSSILEKFAFSNSRAVNSHTDYSFHLSQGATVQKSFVEPGNPLSIYKDVVNRGLITLSDEDTHNLKYVIKDVKGNTSLLQFQVKNNPQLVVNSRPTAGVKEFQYNTVNEYSTEDFKITIPKGVLYSDLNFNYSRTAKSGYWSNFHTAHTRLVPLHENITVAIKPTKEVSAHLKSKLLIVNANGGYAGGSFDEKDGFVKGYPRTFGTFYVSMDTVAPVIRPVNISDGKDLTGTERIVLKVSDNMSGVRSVSGYIDGKWVLMEYDLKTSTIWHKFDSLTPAGKHLFELRVSDMQQNIRFYSATFYR